MSIISVSRSFPIPFPHFPHFHPFPTCIVEAFLQDLQLLLHAPSQLTPAPDLPGAHEQLKGHHQEDPRLFQPRLGRRHRLRELGKDMGKYGEIPWIWMLYDLYDVIYDDLDLDSAQTPLHGFREKWGHNLTWESSWGESCMFLRGCLVLNCLD